MMRARSSIFFAATLLSFPGMISNFLACIYFVGSGSILATTAFFLSSAYAWAAYIVIGAGWIEGKKVGKIWWVLGTLSGLLALNFGGSALFTQDYSPAVMAIPALLVSPAILISAWAILFQLRKKNPHVN
jgi:hypothetical protein